MDFLGDTELELDELEPLVNLDEEDEEEAELFESFKDFVEVCLPPGDTHELLLSLLALEEDEEELSGSGFVSSTSSPISSTVTKSSMLNFCSSKWEVPEETTSSLTSS